MPDPEYVFNHSERRSSKRKVRTTESTISANAILNSRQSCFCSSPGHDVKLRYEGGKTYIYDFDSESITQVLGSTDESSHLKIKGQAVLEAQSQCGFVLTVKDATVQSPDGKVRYLQAL